MIKLVVRKTGIGLLWIFAISILAFILSQQVPGDVVSEYLAVERLGIVSDVDPVTYRNNYKSVAQKRGLDLPGFYFSFQKGYLPKDMSVVALAEEKIAVSSWSEQSHNGPLSLTLYEKGIEILQRSCPQSASSKSMQDACIVLDRLWRESNISAVDQGIDQLLMRTQEDTLSDASHLAALQELKTYAGKLTDHHSLSFDHFIPRVTWNGFRNQYHQWMTGFITVRPLTSLHDGRNAWKKIGEALQWTLIINLITFFLAIVLGCYIGIWSSRQEGKRREKIVSIFLFAVFAIPSFWLATLLVLFFSSGQWVSVFPSGGLGAYHAAQSFLGKWSIILWHLALPVICLTAGTLAYISRQMKTAVQHEMKQPYVEALRAMGVSETSIVRKYVLKNAMLPIVTLAGNSLPGLISGSLVIEVIFSIPGMGRLLYTSILARDWPVVFPVLMLTAVITVVTYLITDIVYAWIDPRIKVS